MSELRALTDAELDFVSGGLGMVGGCNNGTATFAAPRQTSCGGGELKLAEEIVVAILRILEPQKQKTRVLAD